MIGGNGHTVYRQTSRQFGRQKLNRNLHALFHMGDSFPRTPHHTHTYKPTIYDAVWMNDIDFCSPCRITASGWSGFVFHWCPTGSCSSCTTRRTVPTATAASRSARLVSGPKLGPSQWPTQQSLVTRTVCWPFKSKATLRKQTLFSDLFVEWS